MNKEIQKLSDQIIVVGYLTAAAIGLEFVVSIATLILK